jgi:N-glycosylase/DNA lyase
MQNISNTDSILIQNLRKEYALKQDKISARLNDFTRFYNEQYSWYYENKVMGLKPVNRDDNLRIFEELSFCIFTANTSAEMGLKAVDSIRDILMDGTAKDMSKKLEGVYRFNNLRPQYIVHTREYLKDKFDFKIKDKIESLKSNTQELRDFFAINPGIKGLSFKEASHFLRNIGFKGYAILDKHIINSLMEFNVIQKNTKLPLNKKTYPEVEQKLIKFSSLIDIPVDELDLLLWSRKNGRILK